MQNNDIFLKGKQLHAKRKSTFFLSTLFAIEPGMQEHSIETHLIYNFTLITVIMSALASWSADNSSSHGTTNAVPLV